MVTKIAINWEFGKRYDDKEGDTNSVRFAFKKNDGIIWDFS